MRQGELPKNPHEGGIMEGTIAEINHRRGMVAVLTDSGYSIFELLDSSNCEAGDEVSWKDDTALGGEVVTNRTQGWRSEVYFQNHYVSKHQLRQQLLY